MADEECIHGLDPRWCSICLGHDKPEPLTVVFQVRAKYDSSRNCSGCNLPIMKG